MTICIFNCHRLLSSCFETMPHPWHCGRTPPPAPSGWWEWSCAGSACHGFGASDRMTRKPLRCPSGGCRCSQSVSPAGLRASLWRWQRWTGDVFSGSCRRNPTNWPIGPAFLEITLSRRINANFSWSLGKGNMLQPTGGRFLILYDIIKPSPAIVVSKYRLKTPTNWENHLKPAESVWDVSAGNTFPICGKQNAPQKLTMHHPLFKALGAGFLQYDVV